jgi:hypothetical protein
MTEQEKNDQGLTVLKNEFVTWMIYRIIFKGRAVVMCQNKSLYDKQMLHLAFEIKLSNKTIICSVIKILGIFSLETKFTLPFGSGNFWSLEWYFSQIPLPNMIYLFNIIQ